MKTKTLKQTTAFKCTPQEVYDALMDSKKHSAFTGGKASISPKVGGKYTAYDGYIEGENLELVPGKLIRQSWISTDFPEGHDSEVIFKIDKSGTGAKLTFTHKNIPEDQYEPVKQGWIDFYWNPMKELLDK